MPAILVLAIIGTGVAAYLTYSHYNQGALVCSVGSCHTVQQSRYATIGPVPIAILGFGMYVTLLALAAARLWGRTPINESLATTVSWTIVLAGWLYAAYLTYIELFVIDAICQWCVVSAVVTTIILVLESMALWRVLELNDISDD